MLIATALLTLPVGCAVQQSAAPVEQGGVSFEQLAPLVWLHTSYLETDGNGRIRSNGLIVTDGETATLIDTAWTDEQTATVLDWVEANLAVSVTQAIFTHAHVDKMGGVGAVRQRGIATYAHPLSNSVAFSRDLVPAEFDLAIDGIGQSVDLGGIEATVGASPYHPRFGAEIERAVLVAELPFRHELDLEWAIELL